MPSGTVAVSALYQPHEEGSPPAAKERKEHLGGCAGGSRVQRCTDCWCRGAASTRGAAWWAEGDPGITHTSAATTFADRCVVFYRPLRPGVRKHGRSASSAHGTTDGELVVQWGSGAP